MKNNKIIKSIGIILLTVCYTTFFFKIFNINPTDLSNKKVLIYESIANLTLLIIFIVIYKNTLISDYKEYKKNLVKNLSTSFKYWLIAFIIMFLSNYVITNMLNKTIAGNEDLVEAYINISPLLMLFNTIIYSPIVEELTFRKNIREAINNKWIYILISGLLFGLLHIISFIKNPIDLIYLIPYGIFGIIFAYLYYKTNNIYSTITIHMFHNTLAFIIYLLGVSL